MCFPRFAGAVSLFFFSIMKKITGSYWLHGTGITQRKGTCAFFLSSAPTAAGEGLTRQRGFTLVRLKPGKKRERDHSVALGTASFLICFVSVLYCGRTRRDCDMQYNAMAPSVGSVSLRQRPGRLRWPSVRSVSRRTNLPIDRPAAAAQANRTPDMSVHRQSPPDSCRCRP